MLKRRLLLIIVLEFGDFNHTKVQWKSPKISSIKKAIIKSNKTL